MSGCVRRLYHGGSKTGSVASMLILFTCITLSVAHII
jgi:hypothetical protein